MHRKPPAAAEPRAPKSVRDLVDKLIRETFGADVVDLERQSGGAVGRVYRVDLAGAGTQQDGGARATTRPTRVCLKLIRDAPDPPFDAEPLEDRVYGGRPGNHDAARAALQDAIPLPRLFAAGASDGFRYWIMEWLDGMSVVDWTGDADRERPGLYRRIGCSLAELHCVERDYPGWIALPEAQRWAWKPAFVHTLEDAIERAAAASPAFRARQAAVRVFAERECERWGEPASYSLSHPDGLQGLARHDGTQWRFVGAVDVEDHLFTDPRLPLAGVALQAESRGEALPADFRAGYESIRPWPGDAEQVRPAYQLMFLCTWTHVLGDPPGLAERALAVAGV